MFEKAFMLAGSITLLISSNSDVNFEEENKIVLQAYLPELIELEQLPEEPDLRIIHLEKEGFSLEQSDSQVTIKEKWRNKLSPDLPHLMYGMARRHWIHHGLFSIHSACVGNEKEGFVLLVGQAGSGKTSTALECVRRYGLEIYSGDKTLIEVDENATLWAIGGTKVLTSRAPEKGRWREMVDEAVQVGARYAFRLRSEYYPDAKRVRIKAVVLLSLNDGHDSSNEYSSLSAIHNLYPFFLDTQKEDVLLDEGNEIFFGTIRPEVKQKNVPRLARGIKKIRTINVVGSMDYVTEQIADLFKERVSS